MAAPSEKTPRGKRPRNSKTSNARTKRATKAKGSPATKKVRRPKRLPNERKRAAKPAPKARVKAARKPVASGTRGLDIKVLDPQRFCGARTSVKHLLRFRETIDGMRRSHLVFFDRHGWYCEHGRDCHAVTLVRRAFPNLPR